MRKLELRIIFFVLTVFVVTSCFNQAIHAYSFAASNKMIEWDNNSPIIWDNETEVKCDFKVANVEWSLTDKKLANLQINNAYPAYQTIITTKISNVSNVPVKLEGAKVELTDGDAELIEVNFTAVDGVALHERVLEKNESVDIKLDVKVADMVKEKQKFLFRIIINAKQATEGSGQNGDNGHGDKKPSKGGDYSSGGSQLINEGKNEKPIVDLETPELYLSTEKEILPEGLPQLTEVDPELVSQLPIIYEELPYTGGRPYFLAGAIFSWAGIGVLLRKRIF